MISSQQTVPDVFGPVLPVLFEHSQEPCVVRCQFDVKHYHDALFACYGVNLPNQLARAVPKRRCEYLAGRVLFQHLAHHYQLPFYQLINTLSGAPRWPKSFTGSISHADGNAICCMMPSKIYSAIGIDIETILSLNNATDLASHIVQPKELGLLHGIQTISYVEALTLAFSAKESLYKALYPEVQQFFGFEDAELVMIKTDKQQFTLKLTANLSAKYKKGMLFNGNYCFIGQQIISLIALPASESL